MLIMSGGVPNIHDFVMRFFSGVTNSAFLTCYTLSINNIGKMRMALWYAYLA